MKENNQNIDDKRVPKFIVKEYYPFSPYRVGATIQPVGELLTECLKFPRIFKNVTVQYSIEEYNDKAVISVKRLKDGQIFKVGDKVEYTLDHLTETCLFTISAFQEIEDGNIALCWDSTERKNSQAVATGINIVEIHKCKKKGEKYFQLT